MTSENNSIIEQLVRSNKDFALVDNDFTLKAEPIAKVSDFIGELRRLLVEGEVESTLEYIKVLENPELFLMRGFFLQTKTLSPTKRIEDKMRRQLERQMKESGREGSLERAMEVLFAVNRDMTWKERLKLTSQRTALWITNFNRITRDTGTKYKVVATRFIPSFWLQYIDTEERVEGQWKFPSCYIGVKIGIIKDAISINAEKNPYIIYPRNYVHPFLYQDTKKICLGNAEDDIKDDMSHTSSTYKNIKILLDKGEQILVNGYNKPKSKISPVTYITDNDFDDYKEKKKVSDEFREMIKEYKDLKDKVRRKI